jgi:hypothetical protein
VSRFKNRLRALEEKIWIPRAHCLEPPQIVSIYVDSKAPSENPGQTKWGTIKGVREVFERNLDESEDDFVARLIALHPTPRERLIDITIHAETLKPEPPALKATFPSRGEARLR